MSSDRSYSEALLSRLDKHLKSEGYSQSTRQQDIAEGRRFLEYITQRSIVIEAVQPVHVAQYLRRELRRYRLRHGHSPKSRKNWRWAHGSCIHMLLRVINGQWPPVSEPATTLEVFQQQICHEYAQWLSTCRGLAAQSTGVLLGEARRFLAWLGERGGSERLAQLSGEAIEAYLTFRAPSLCRRSRKSKAQYLRSFLRYLHTVGRINRDLAPFVIAPALYAFETIPSALRAEEVQAVIKAAQQDRSAKGLRDYAILLLLSTYGLRQGEVMRLRIDDVDWRRETLTIRHTKTGTKSIMPLLCPVGEAILAYLRTGRPKTSVRELFVRVYAPYRPLHCLYELIQDRLRQARGFIPLVSAATTLFVTPGLPVCSLRIRA